MTHYIAGTQLVAILRMTMLCITERDEASTDTSEHNSTSFTEVDKRVKRRLLMGNNDTRSSLVYPDVCYFQPSLRCQEPLRGVTNV